MKWILLLTSFAFTSAHNKQTFLELIKDSIVPKAYTGYNLIDAPRELLLETITSLREELSYKTEMLADSNCTVCFSSPCVNGGICNPVSDSEYYCDCPDDYSGHNCETHVVCQDDSCGANTQCYVQNHQTNCVCNKGFSGDPSKNCSLVVKSACYSGDPHYVTFDGLTLNYMGSCPYVYSQPCGELSNGYAYYSVKSQNYMAEQSTYAVASSVEIEMYGQVITMLSTGVVFFNQITVAKPFYWPNQNEPKITITAGNRVQNDQQVAVTFVGSEVCLYVPDIPEFQGASTLCGLAGNIDGDWTNDLLMSNGTVYPAPADQTAYTRVDDYSDTWLTSDYWHYDNQVACSDGKTATDLSGTCDLYNSGSACQAIYDAMLGQGPFAACSPMDKDVVQAAYDHCEYVTCADPTNKCEGLTDFAHQCQQAVPSANISGWRDDGILTGCPVVCPAHSTFQDCTTFCPSTCSSHDAPDHCDHFCQDGCDCDYGYVVDNTQPGLTCIPVQDCGCNDPDGNMHAADVPWLTDNCTVTNRCSNGTYLNQANECSVVGHCDIIDGAQQCVCDTGYVGDGYTCKDINECIDTTVCSVNLGQGTCTNTAGSYFCTCSPYFEGSNCDQYRPNRHCADLFVYHDITASGVYQILPDGASKQVSVYCDMDVEGGGWTIVSASIGGYLNNRTYAEYVAGIGPVLTGIDDQATSAPDIVNAWIGLETLSLLTENNDESLRVELFRCHLDGTTWEDTRTDCTYDYFSVLGNDTEYAVNITEVCHGSETSVGYGEGWARWDLTKPGPKFVAVDTDTSFCSSSFQNVGWWYDGARCGYANLNGARLDCGETATQDPASYIEWAGTPISQARMLIRPRDFPDYDLKDWM